MEERRGEKEGNAERELVRKREISRRDVVRKRNSEVRSDEKQNITL